MMVANATLFNNTAPIWVGLISCLVFRKRLQGIFWLVLELTMSGAAIVLSGNAFENQDLRIGDLIALLSGFFYAAYYLVREHGRKGLSTLMFTGVANVVSAITLLLISIVFGLKLKGFPVETYLVFVGAALISQIVGHFSLTYALGHLPASLVAPTMVAQPVLTALIAIPLVGEMLMPVQWIGGAAVLVGIYTVTLGKEV
jgi:drug/metabolite transporter (DMT)-like permease